MRKALFFIVAGAVGLAQPARPVEDLRALAREKIGAFQAELDREMPDLLAQLAALDPEIAGPQVDEPRAKLGRFVPAFPDRFLNALKSDNRPRVRLHLLAILQRYGQSDLAPRLIDLIPSVTDGLGVAVVELAGELARGTADAKLLSVVRQSPPASPAVLGAALKALALSKTPDGITAARSLVGHETALIRRDAVTALSFATSGGRDDFAVVQKVATGDPDPEVRKFAIRSLAAFPKLPEAQRLAHDTLVVNDSGFQAAALDALEKIGTRDSSPSHLLQFVQTTAPDPLRERAARLMAGPFDDARGSKHLAKPLRETADRTPKDVNAQMEAGDYLKSLLAFEDAIIYYKRASSLYQAAQQWRARVQLARCNARLGRFDEAKRLLRADYKDRDIAKNFVDDPDFAAMKADSRFKGLFEASKGE